MSRPPFRKQFRDALDRPLEGKVILRPEGVTSAPITLEVINGELVVDLRPGEYRLLAELRTPEGATTYQTDTITVGAYW